MCEGQTIAFTFGNIFLKKMLLEFDISIPSSFLYVPWYQFLCVEQMVRIRCHHLQVVLNNTRFHISKHSSKGVILWHFPVKLFSHDAQFCSDFSTLYFIRQHGRLWGGIDLCHTYVHVNSCALHATHLGIECKDKLGA